MGPRYVPVHAHQQHSCHECSKDLGEYIIGNFSPGEALPNSEANCDGWIKVTTRCRGAGDDGKSDTNSKAPSDLKDTTESCGIGLSGIYIERSDGCYAGEAGAMSVPWPSPRKGL